MNIAKLRQMYKLFVIRKPKRHFEEIPIKIVLKERGKKST